MIQELFKSNKLVNKVRSFVEVNLDFALCVDNSFLTKIAPFNARIPPERLKDTKDYVYNEKSSDKAIKADKYGLTTGQKIAEPAVERIVDQLASLCSCLKEKPYIQI